MFREREREYLEMRLKRKAKPKQKVEIEFFDVLDSTTVLFHPDFYNSCTAKSCRQLKINQPCPH